jgi:spore maturation protein CgeB
MHLETHLDALVADAARLMRTRAVAPSGLPGSGLRLLYVAQKLDYGNPARGYSYEENHFLPALAALGFDIVPFDSRTLIGRLGKRTAGDLLVEVAFRFRPHAAFFVLFKDDFSEGAIEEVKRLGCVTFNWFADDHWRFEAFSQRWAPRFTWAITTDPAAVVKYHERGVTNVIRSQWGVNHHLYRPLDRPRRFDVTFIGQPHGNRRSLLRALQRQGVAVEAWGYGWPRGKLSTRQAVEVINESAVNLNLSKAVTGRVDQIKGRDFEVPACRALLVTQQVEALDDYFTPGAEVLVYDGFDDLVAKIRWALAHREDAERVREAGYLRVLSEHTYERRFTEIFRQAGLHG